MLAGNEDEQIYHDIAGLMDVRNPTKSPIYAGIAHIYCGPLPICCPLPKPTTHTTQRHLENVQRLSNVKENPPQLDRPSQNDGAHANQ